MTQDEDFSFLFMVPTGDAKVLLGGTGKRAIGANDLVTVGRD
jgi:hypothetical protein